MWSCLTTVISHLRKHGENKHDERVISVRRYQWSLCEDAATRIDGLNRHIEYKHKGFKYSCTKCVCEAPTPSAL